MLDMLLAKADSQWERALTSERLCVFDPRSAERGECPPAAIRDIEKSEGRARVREGATWSLVQELLCGTRCLRELRLFSQHGGWHLGYGLNGIYRVKVVFVLDFG